MATAHFTPALFKFLRELAANNNRDWFEKNRVRYLEDVREPMLAFIRDFALHLRRVNPHFVADPSPVGGSMFRIHRDMRFAAKGEGPYKTVAAAQFRHAMGKDVHAPGFYLHLEPRRSFVGGGIWRPEASVRNRIRARIFENEGEWRKVLQAPGMKRLGGVDGEMQNRAPRHVEPEHKFYDDLRRTEYLFGASVTMPEACSEVFMERVAGIFRDGLPLVSFIARAIEIPV